MFLITETGILIKHFSDYRDKIYVTVPVTVINLGDTTHTEYRSNKSCTVDYDSGTLASLLETFE